MGKKYLAEKISLFFNPLIIVLPLLAFTLHLSGLELPEVARWITLSLVVVVLPLGLFIRSRNDNYLVGNQSREKRITVYFAAIMTVLILGFITLLLSAPTAIWRFLAATFLTLMIGLYFNNFVKLSVHTVVPAFFSFLMLGYSLPFSATGFFFTGLIAWSRYELNMHTFKALVAGFLLPLPAVLLLFMI